MSRFFKVALIATTLVASLSLFVACDDDGGPVAPPHNPWTLVFDSTTVKLSYDSSDAQNVKYQLVMTDSATVGGTNYYSIAHLMALETGNFTNLETVIVNYSVATADDSLALGIVSGYTTDFGAPDYNYFTAILTSGKATPGVPVSDTIAMSGFNISWVDATNPTYPLGTTLASAGVGEDFRKTANAFRFEGEDLADTVTNVTSVELYGIILIGPGIGTDMGQTNADTAYVAFDSGWTGMGGSYQ